MTLEEAIEAFAEELGCDASDVKQDPVFMVGSSKRMINLHARGENKAFYFEEQAE